MDKLTKCPFCNSDKLTIEQSAYMISAYKVRVVCHKCGANGGYVISKENPQMQGGYDSQAYKDAADKWNTRTEREDKSR